MAVTIIIRKLYVETLLCLVWLAVTMWYCPVICHRCQAILFTFSGPRVLHQLMLLLLLAGPHNISTVMTDTHLSVTWVICTQPRTLPWLLVLALAQNMNF